MDTGTKINGNLEGYIAPSNPLDGFEFKEKLPIDILKVYYKDTIELDSGIILRQPTIAEIKEFGEKRFWKAASTLCANPTSFRVMLWDEGIDWNKLDDFEFFSVLIQGITKEESELFFANVDIRQFRAIIDEDEKLNLVYLPNPDIQLDQEAYSELVSYLRIFYGIHPKTEKTKGRTNKEIIIMEERNRFKFAAYEHKDQQWEESQLFPLISSAVNQSGFKYSIDECLNLSIFQFLDSIKRQTVIQEASSLMYGMYSGMVDIKQNKLQGVLDWTRDLYV